MPAHFSRRKIVQFVHGICKEDFGLNQILEDEIFIMYLVCSVVMVCTASFKVELLTIGAFQAA